MRWGIVFIWVFLDIDLEIEFQVQVIYLEERDRGDKEDGVRLPLGVSHPSGNGVGLFIYQSGHSLDEDCPGSEVGDLNASASLACQSSRGCLQHQRMLSGNRMESLAVR